MHKRMAIDFAHTLHFSPLSFLPSPPPPKPLVLPVTSPSPFRFRRNKILVASSPSPPPHGRMDHNKFMDFPFVSASHRELMVHLVSTVESRLESQLLPCTLPSDVQYCCNESGTAEASLYVRSGHRSSSIDLILGSWLHCQLPTGSALNITSLSAYLNPSTDAPNFVIELIQSSATSMVIILDLPPRKDLILHPDYLQTFYENTHLDTQRKMLEKLPEVKPYISSSLYLRSVISPTAIMINVEANADGPPIDEIVKNNIDPVAREVVGIWLDHCAFTERQVGEEERKDLKKRDQLMKSKFVEIDLGSNFPRLFGQEISNRVVGTIREAYNV